jgi:hypothetical protein
MPYPSYAPGWDYGGYGPTPAPEEEMVSLRGQADAIRAQLVEIERRIQELQKSEE